MAWLCRIYCELCEISSWSVERSSDICDNAGIIIPSLIVLDIDLIVKKMIFLLLLRWSYYQ